MVCTEETPLVYGRMEWMGGNGLIGIEIGNALSKSKSKVNGKRRSVLCEEGERGGGGDGDDDNALNGEEEKMGLGEQ